jgi:epoxide hydrolase-like predicted phosphatase
MSIEAVVLDLGGVLEVIDDAVFPGPWEQRLDLGSGGFARAVPEAGLGGNPALGQVTESEVRTYWQRCLTLDDETTDRLMRDYWRWYVGTLDLQLYDWFASLQPRFRTAILSNSGPGAREHEACWELEAITDDIVYSHEVGLAKPDPAIYELAASRLHVRPNQIVFLDDLVINVNAARAAGWHGVHHVNTSRSIAEIDTIIREQGWS